MPGFHLIMSLLWRLSRVHFIKDLHSLECLASIMLSWSCLLVSAKVNVSSCIIRPQQDVRSFRVSINRWMPGESFRFGGPLTPEVGEQNPKMTMIVSNGTIRDLVSRINKLVGCK